MYVSYAFKFISNFTTFLYFFVPFSSYFLLFINLLGFFRFLSSSSDFSSYLPWQISLLQVQPSHIFFSFLFFKIVTFVETLEQLFIIDIFFHLLFLVEKLPTHHFSEIIQYINKLRHHLIVIATMI